MADAVVLRSAWGAMFRTLLAVFPLAAVLMLVLVPGAPVIGAVLLVVEAVLLFCHYIITYTFDDEKLTVRGTGLMEPPAFYDRIYSVADVDPAPASYNIHGFSRDAILIRYDRGTGHFLCISPRDKERALGILRERCPDAEFSTERRGRFFDDRSFLADGHLINRDTLTRMWRKGRSSVSECLAFPEGDPYHDHALPGPVSHGPAVRPPPATFA